MIFEINKDNGIPLYIQIESKYAEWISQGVLQAGEKLPATRDLARQLKVHRNTVVQAYQEMEIKGLVSSEIGRGTFVAQHAIARKIRPTVVKPFSFDGLYSERWTQPDDDVLLGIENMVRCSHRPEGIIAFSSVVPDKNIFPLRDFQNCTYHAIHKYGVDLLEMGDTRGFGPFLDYLPKFLTRRGMTVHNEEIMIVSGIQQGLDLIGRILINPGDTVVMEDLTYRGAPRAFRALGANVIGVPMDAHGMRTDILETILHRQKVKMIYTIPTFQNPTGRIMPMARRKHLLELAARHEIPILEDQYANELRLDGEEVLPLAAMDTQGVVIAVGSFSKILFHGIRLGWVVTTNTEFMEKLIYAKRITDWQNNYLIQGAILEFCQDGFFDRYLKKKLKILRGRRDAMVKASREFFSDGVRFEAPLNGLFEWIELPKSIDAYEVLNEARAHGVLFTPKRIFAVRSDYDNGMRLGFTALSPDQIYDGIKILSDIIKNKIRVGRMEERMVAPLI